MKKFAALVILLVAVVALSAQSRQTPKPTGTSGSSSDANMLMSIENQWPDAMIKKDTSFIQKYYADDITDVGPDGNVTTKQQDIDDLKNGNFVLTGATNADVQPRVYGNFAVVTGEVHIDGKYKGKDISGRYRYTDTYAKQNGQWKLVATQATKIQNYGQEEKK